MQRASSLVREEARCTSRESTRRTATSTHLRSYGQRHHPHSRTEFAHTTANLLTSRQNVEATLIPHPDDVAAVTTELHWAQSAYARRRDYGVATGRLEVYLIGGVRYLLTVVATPRKRLDPADDAIAAVLLREREIRMVMLALADTTRANAAHKLWHHLAVHLPGPDHAEAAALLGFSAHRRGEYLLAARAYDMALRTNPFHELARPLRGLVQQRDDSRGLQTAASEGWDIAHAMGISMPATAKKAS